jgi:hypothetical protein
MPDRVREHLSKRLETLNQPGQGVDLRASSRVAWYRTPIRFKIGFNAKKSPDQLL